MGCYCCCWVSAPVMLCGDHEGCAVTPQHCAWPECIRTREVHELFGGPVTIR